MNLRQAQRSQARIKMGLQGPSGSGKTYSSLFIAYGLCGDWRKIVVIDSENNSADLYAHLGPFNVLGLGSPFSPEKYIEAIDLCVKARMEVVILDSVSHEWEGSGGILDIHGSMTGNSFTNWNRVTPRHNAFVQKMLQSPVHIISTIRSKQDYVLSEKNGKMVPEKVGLRGVTREGLDYEFTVVLDLDIKHNCSASKDRTGLFMDKPPFVISADTGQLIREWCEDGLSIESVLKEINEAGTVEELRQIHSKYPAFRDQIIDELTIRKMELSNPIESQVKMQ